MKNKFLLLAFIFFLWMTKTETVFAQIEIQKKYSSEKTFGAPPFSCDTFAYLFQGVPTGIYRVTLSTGNTILLHDSLISAPPNQQLNAFGFNPADNFIWGYRLHTNELVRVASNFSVDIFPVSGLPSTGFNVGTIDNNGIMYLTGTNQTIVYRIDLNPNSVNYLLLLSPLTIELTSIFDWAYNPIDDNIYGIDSLQIAVYRFNKISGARTFVGLASGEGIDTVGRFGATYSDVDGNLFVSANAGGKIFKINSPDSGNTSAVLFSQGPGSGNNDGALCPGVFIGTPVREIANQSVEVKIFPQPANEEIYVSSNSNECSSFFLFNLSSQVILEKNFLNSTQLNIQSLPSGIYFYEVKNNKGVYFGKLVKQ
jgi:hypothetical protein